jgi:hypothetical protein
VRASILRALDPSSKGGRQRPLFPIKGARAYAEGQAKRVQGIEVPDDSTIVFTLTEPLNVFPKLLAIPVAASFLILVFAVTLRWLPPSGAGGLAYLVLPALTLGMRSVAFLSRMNPRGDAGGVAERLRPHGAGQGTGGRPTGSPACVPERAHAGGDGAGPRLRELSYRLDPHRDDLFLARRGPLRAHRHRQRDLPAIQGSILFLSLVFVLVNLITDLVYARVEPRVSYE